MSLITTDGFKDLCGNEDDDPEELYQNGSMFNSFDFQDVNGNTHQPDNSEAKDENSIENISDDKISNGQFSLDVNMSQLDRSPASQVSLDYQHFDIPHLLMMNYQYR